MLTKILLQAIAILLLSYGHLFSQLNPEWTNSYNGSGNNNDEATDCFVDDLGNVYAAGKIFQTNSLFDIYVVKYNPSGVLLWENIYNGSGNGNDFANSITSDKNGNIYVAGESKGVNTGGDYILIKYDNLGNEMWTRSYDGESNSSDAVIKVITDIEGNPIISGRSFNFASMSDIVTIKYNSDGDLLWSKKYNGISNGNDFIGDMEIDVSGNIYLSGSSFVQGEGDNFLIIKYNMNGDTLWTKVYNGPANANDNSTSLTIDSNYNIIISGSSAAPGTGIDFATLKYSGAGEELWVRRYTSSAISSPDEPKDITSDINGNIFVTGTSVEFNSYDYLTVKYSPSGDELWTRRYNGPSSNNFDEPRSLVTDLSGNVFVAGLSQGTGTMDDMVIFKYDSTGNEIWIYRYNSINNRNDVANNISVDVSGNLSVCGFISSASTLNDFAVIKFSQLTNLDQISEQNVSGFQLYGNFPNPFNPSTEIEFSVSKATELKLVAYNIHGKEIVALAHGIYKPGKYKIKFDASGLSSGIYFYNLISKDQNITGKMLLIK